MTLMNRAQKSQISPSAFARSKDTQGATDAASPCCGCREGEDEIKGKFSRIFKEYGRDKKYHNRGPNIPYSIAELKWEKFYYYDSYRYHMKYDKAGVYTTVRVKPTNKTLKPPKIVRRNAPTMAETKSDDDIKEAFKKWRELVVEHWSNKYIVHLKDARCPGKFPLNFDFVRKDKKPHVKFDIVALKDPRDPGVVTAFDMNKAQSDPKNPNHKTAVKLIDLWRSDAGKINVSDDRSFATLIPHEYGHWIGWGDEYIETESDKIADPDDSTKQVDYELRGSKKKPIRVAVRIKNITNVYKKTKGTDKEVIDLSSPSVMEGLMAEMNSPLTPHPRYVYVVADDFVKLYNRDNKAKATCEDVLTK